ncbi:hypothetical protein DPV78_000378 [Talaromyces pinophilus]|nr:hypothetical protein DPV78_000378 [Talaromyces pinophilus]
MRRPHLASSVKQLLPWRHELFFDGSKEDTQTLKRAARELLLNVDGDPNFKGSYGDHGQKHFLTELAIALLQNLEACVTEIEYDITDEELVPVNRFLDSRFKRLQSKQPGLPSIRALGFAKEDDWGFSLATPGIAVLLSAAAPNLERFGVRWHAWIWNGVSGMDWDIDGGHLPPARFIEALDSVKERLKVLGLDLTESTHPGSPEEWVLTSSQSSLASFQRLESLRLDELSFCLHYVDAFYNMHTGGLANEPTCLTNILPRTVRFLTVILVGEGYAWLDIARVAFVAEKEFPRLEAVTVERRDHRGLLHRPGRPRMAQEAFEQSRVRYSCADWNRYDGAAQCDDVYSYSLVGND